MNAVVNYIHLQALSKKITDNSHWEAVSGSFGQDINLFSLDPEFGYHVGKSLPLESVESTTYPSFKDCAL
jgi:hypothetical protein